MSGTRGLEVGLIVAVTAAAVGLISGVHGTGRDMRTYVKAAPPAAAPVEARSYSDERARMYGPNAELAPGWWSQLDGPPRDLFAEVVQTPADKAAALQLRADRRAYDGAPPTIPHEVDQLAVPTCLTCHEDGVTVGGRTAPPISHRRMASCVQCHVVMRDPRRGVADVPAPVASTFVGLASPATGARAWTGAPPTIPHRTLMRERCDACHGLEGRTGMRTPHPWRTSCTQCHAPSAVLDQRAPAALGGRAP